MVDRIVDRRGGVGVEREAVGPDDAKRHDVALEAHADAAQAVVRSRCHDSGDGGPVSEKVQGVCVVGDEVVAGLDCALEIGVRRIDARVDDRDDDVRRPRVTSQAAGRFRAA